MRGLRKIEFKFCNYAKERGIYEALCNPPAADGNPPAAGDFLCLFVFINMIPSNPAEVVLRIQQTPIITEEAIAEMEERWA